MIESRSSASNQEYSMSNQNYSQNRSSTETIPEEQSDDDGAQDISGRLRKILMAAESKIKSGRIESIEEAINNLSLLLQKIKFLDSNAKVFDKKIELICLYNLSCAYQVLAFNKNHPHALDSCISTLYKSIIFNKTLIYCPEQRSFSFKLHFLQIKMNLQYCALLSQIDKHKQALQISIKSIDHLIIIFKKGQYQCQQFLQKEECKNDEFIFFSKNLLKQSEKSLKELAKTESYLEILGSKNDQILQIKEKCYFWSTNFQNNEKSLRKQLNLERGQYNSQSSRNVLGLRVSNDWIKNFSIGKIMHMKPVNCYQFQEPDNLAFEFNFRNIIEKVILTSTAYFSIATQMRFLQAEAAKNQNPSKKTQKKQNDELKLSQIFHLKAIETSCKYILESTVFVDHLVNSYHRHYHNNLNTIVQESSSAEYSLMSSNKEKIQKSQVSKQLSSILAEFKQDDNQFNRQKKANPLKKKDPIFLFKKKKKNSHLFQSGQIDLEGLWKTQREQETSTKQKTMRINIHRKMEKSSSITNLTSLRSQKKQFSSRRGKDSLTIKISKSPQPSFSSQKLKSIKSLNSLKKSARTLLTHRGR